MHRADADGMLQPPLKLRRILLADTDHGVIGRLCSHIEAVFPEAELHQASSLGGIREQLKQHAFDFLITDLNFPDAKGINTLHILHALNETLPILVHADEDNARLALQVVRAGAQDYLLKGKGNALTFKRIIEHSLERKRLIMTSRRNEQMLQTFIQYAPAGIAVFDLELKLLMASDRWFDDHQLSANNAVGQPLYMIFTQHLGRLEQLCHDCLLGEHIRCEDNKFITNDGTHHDVRWELMPWYDIAGRVGGIIQFTDFITEQRRARRELEEAKNTLEQKVDERTNELASAMIMLREASKAKEEFFANMTHELRTPLHAIINFSRFGLKKIDNAPKEKIREYFSDILRSGERLLGLVNDLLDLTKLEAGKSEFQFEVVEVSSLVDAVAREMAGVLDYKKQRLQSDIAEHCKPIRIDMRRMHQVLVNLIGNASKFSPEGSTITVRAEPACNLSGFAASDNVKSTNGLALSVIDEGEGIPAHELKSVFDEFAQSGKVRSGAFHAGTGLGLSICRRIVQAHQGLIWAENHPDAGAILRCVLPMDISKGENP